MSMKDRGVNCSRALCSFMFVCLCGCDVAPDPQTIHIASLSDPYTLNPFHHNTADGDFVSRHLYEALVLINCDGHVEPAQALRWSLDSEGRIWRFRLREGLLWSNGEPLLADDFVYAFRYLANPNNALWQAELLAMLRIVHGEAVMRGQLPVEHLRVWAEDQHTVVIELEKPVRHALYIFSRIYPLYRPCVERYGQAWPKVGQMVVNGAYLPAQWVLNERLVLASNRHYRNATQVSIKRAILYPLTPEDELTRYKACALDITRQLLPGRMAWYRAKFGQEVRVTKGLEIYFYMLNTGCPKLADTRVRCALAYAIDREVISSKLLGCGQLPAFRFIPPQTVMSVLPPASTALTEQDRIAMETEALRLYHEAGYGPEKPLEVEILYNPMELHRQLALVVADMWRQTLGVKVTLCCRGWSVVQERINKGQFNVAKMSWRLPAADPCFVLPLFHSAAPYNCSGWCCGQYDSLVEAICYRKEGSRQQMLGMAECSLAQSMPAIPLFYYSDARLVSKRVRFYPQSHQYGDFHIHELALEGPDRSPGG